MAQRVGLADAIKQRELDEEDRESSDGAQTDDWVTGPDSPVKKSAVPVRKLVRPGERAAPPPPTTRPAVTKPQPTGASSAEKRPQSEIDEGVGKAKGKRACDSYEIDLAATEYGMCKCGFKKNEHVQGAAFRAAPRPIAAVYHPEPKAVEKKPVSLPDTHSAFASTEVSSSNEETEQTGGNYPCDAFEVDLQAKEFGTCKCGFKKAAHSKAAQLAGPKKTGGASFTSVQTAEKLAQEERRREQEDERRKAEEEARALQEFQERERKIRQAEENESEEVADQQEASQSHEEPSAEETSDQPRACDSYEIDMNAKEFGTCKCGFKKMDHAKNALFSKPLPKPVHAAPTIHVPSIPKVSGNRAPPAFATAAKPAPAAPAVEVGEEEPAPEVEETEKTDEGEERSPFEETEEAREEHAPEELVAETAEPVEEVTEEIPADEEVNLQTSALDPPQPHKALYDFDGQEVEDLSFKAGDVIEVYEILDAEWMRGRLNDQDGVFPSAYVAKVEEDSAPAAKGEAPAEQAAKVIQEEEVPAEPESVAEEPVEEAVIEPAVDEFAAAEEANEPPVETEAEQAEQPAVESEEAAPEEPAPVEETPVEEPVEVVPEVQAADETAYPEETVAEVQEEAPLPVEEETVVGALEGGEQTLFKATALYDFVGETEEDLSFQAGDVIEVLAIVDNEWWKGSLHGNVGIFPANFVTKEEVVPTEQGDVGGLGFVIAQYDMEAQAEGDLPFNQGDRIKILEIVDDEWYMGALNGMEGLVPKSFVSELSG